MIRGDEIMALKDDIKELKEMVVKLQKRIESLERNNGDYPNPFRPYRPMTQPKKCKKCKGTGIIRDDDWWDSSHPNYFGEY